MPPPPAMMPRRRWYRYRSGGCCGCLPGCVLPLAFSALILGAGLGLLPWRTNKQ